MTKVYVSVCVYVWCHYVCRITSLWDILSLLLSYLRKPEKDLFISINSDSNIYPNQLAEPTDIESLTHYDNVMISATFNTNRLLDILDHWRTIECGTTHNNIIIIGIIKTKLAFQFLFDHENDWASTWQNNHAFIFYFYFTLKQIEFNSLHQL